MTPTLLILGAGPGISQATAHRFGREGWRGALALWTPWLARRFGRDRAILAALTLLLIATAARAFAPSTHRWLSAYAIAWVIAFPLVVVLAPQVRRFVASLTA